ncbi:hypothetical protein PENSPDRAFT_752220 [Peniophora sp. CONT]|nr:hypothetical protein PENSPDRAFT_752220 [Peniophora sp. CONT]
MESSASSSSLRDAWSRRLLVLGAQDDVKAIESSLRDAQAVVRLHALKLNDYNIAVSLPVEILELIFLNTQWLCAFNERDHRLPTSEWVVVTHVCNRWRKVALNFTDLWTNLDTGLYGIHWCIEMLSRMGSQAFSMQATADRDQDLVLNPNLRARAQKQLSWLVLHFGDSIMHPGAFLDAMFPDTTLSNTSFNVRQLVLKCGHPTSMFWASLEPFLPQLEYLGLSYLYPSGDTPTSFPMLTTLTLGWVDLSHGPAVTGILELLPLMPILESATFTNCTFTAPVDTSAVELPLSLQTIHFEASGHGGLSLQHSLDMARLLNQTAGDRVFSFQRAISGPGPAHEIFSQLRDAVNAGLVVREVLIDLNAWATLSAGVEFEKTVADQTRPFVIRFTDLGFPLTWPMFCSTLKDIDMRDASFRIVCNETTGLLSIDNALMDLRPLSVSAINITGRLSCYAAIGIFMALRQPLQGGSESIGTPMPFPALRDLAIEKPPPVPADGVDSDVLSPETLSTQIDESALYLLWYARARRNRALQPLRTVALPIELLHKPWANDLNEAIEQSVISYEVYMHSDEETDSPTCRAVVLYRPVFRAMKFWEPLCVVFAPMIGVLGIVWTSARFRRIAAV